MTPRERWYGYWRAKRKFARHNRALLTQLMIYGQSVDLVDDNHPARDYVKRVIDFAINPPYVYDPMLMEIWPQEKRRQIKKLLGDPT